MVSLISAASGIYLSPN